MPAPRAAQRFVGRASVLPVGGEVRAIAGDRDVDGLRGVVGDWVAEEAGATDGEASPVDRGERRWEIVIAIAIGVITMSSALVTYFALGQESKAAAADQQAVAETVLQQEQYTDATARTQANGGLAARYRRMTAEAEAFQSLDPEEARLAAAIAGSFLRQANIGDYVGDGSASARFDYDGYRQIAIHSHDGEGAGQPDRIAAAADLHRARGQRLALSAVAMLGVVLVLTLARQVRRRRRRVLFAVGTLGYLATVAVPIVVLV